MILEILEEEVEHEEDLQALIDMKLMKGDLDRSLYTKVPFQHWNLLKLFAPTFNRSLVFHMETFLTFLKHR